MTRDAHSKQPKQRNSIESSSQLLDLSYRFSSRSVPQGDSSSDDDGGDFSSVGSYKALSPTPPPPPLSEGRDRLKAYPPQVPVPPARKGSLGSSAASSFTTNSLMGNVIESGLDLRQSLEKELEVEQALLAHGNRLTLPTQSLDGPHMASCIPAFARELAHDSADTVHRASIGLYEKRENDIGVSQGRGGQFWLAFAAVSVNCFLSAVDLTIISPLLPTIASNMPPSSISAAWITSAFLATSASFQPLFGGLSDAIGRRESLLLAITIFLGGSIIAVLARTMLQIVIARAVQGVGGGGMLVVGQIIISDLTTLAERGYFLGLLSIGNAMAALAAPIAGGWLATIDWRIAFYINFPIGLLAILLLLPTKLSKPKLSLAEKVQRVDLLGSAILLGGIVALLIGLTNGGVDSPWTSVNILTPLVVGFASLLAFFLLEAVPNPLSRYPILPAKLFRHRTAAIAYLLTFLHGILLYGATQGLVLYFENRGATPLRAAINILPANAPATPAAFVAGILMALTGRYKPQIVICEALMTSGVALFIYLDIDSPTWQWALFQVLAAVGLGGLYSLTLPPIQATLPAQELAHATATFAFARSFGAVWGVSAFLIAFQSHAGQHLGSIRGIDTLGIAGGNAIDFVSRLGMLPDSIRIQLSDVFQDAIRIGFVVLAPFALTGFVASIFIRHVPLPDFNDSNYRLEGQGRSRSDLYCPEVGDAAVQAKGVESAFSDDNCYHMAHLEHEGSVGSKSKRIPSLPPTYNFSCCNGCVVAEGGKSLTSGTAHFVDDNDTFSMASSKTGPKSQDV